VVEKTKKVYLMFFNGYSKISNAVTKVSTVLCYTLIIFVTSVIGSAVFYRYVLNNPIQWAEEVARYTLIWLTMLAASIAIKKRSHISLTTIVKYLKSEVSLILEIILYGVIIGIIIIIARYSTIMVVTRSVNVFSPSIGIRMLWAHLSLPVGFSLIILQSVYIVLEDIKKLIFESTGED